jgi:hypothetical protein
MDKCFSSSHDPFAEIESQLPPVIARSEVRKLLGGLVAPGTLANADSRGDGPARIRIGRKVGYTRASLIAWLRTRARAL